jgi:hypothetical protein
MNSIEPQVRPDGLSHPEPTAAEVLEARLVKGSMQTADSVELTVNEVTHARQDDTDLVVWRADGGGEIVRTFEDLEDVTEEVLRRHEEPGHPAQR